MNDIDYFLINLKYRNDKLKHSILQLKKINATPMILSVEKPQDVLNFHSIGARGCYESHMKILEIIIESKKVNNLFCVCEDDILFTEEFVNEYHNIINKIKYIKNWDIIYGHSRKRDFYNKIMFEKIITAHRGTHLYILNYNSSIKLYDYLRKNYNKHKNMAVDTIPFKDFDVFAPNRTLVYQNKKLKSDIGNPSSFYHTDIEFYITIDNIKLDKELFDNRNIINNDYLENKIIRFKRLNSNNAYGSSLLKDGKFINSWSFNEVYYSIENDVIKFKNKNNKVTSLIVKINEQFIGRNFQEYKVELIHD